MKLVNNESVLIDYSTDGSVYRDRPLGVVYPRCKEEIRKAILYANTHNISLIARGAGTSLAGQVVGEGIVVDVSRHMNNILKVNEKEKYAIVEPGVVRDVLNKRLKSSGLMFAPETSTSNRCTIAGMVGNNSCGANSLVYDSTREHLLEIKGFLSDGSEVHFKNLNDDEFEEKLLLDGLEGDIYRGLYAILNNRDNREKIIASSPDRRLKRRNNGYAFDMLIADDADSNDIDRNLCKIIAGSEGTLVFITEIKVSLVDLPPPVGALICAHFKTLEESLKANLVMIDKSKNNHSINNTPSVYAVELMDGEILKLAERNGLQKENSFFISGNPGALLIAELRGETEVAVDELCKDMIDRLKESGFGYYYSIVKGKDMGKVWALRKAGLGVLSNMKGDAKPVALIEDTAVIPEYLPEYIKDIQLMLAEYGLKCIYYAHIGTGELHLRPVLNLKDKHDVELFHTIAQRTAELVKKYHGSLSGEHGDGRLRGEFIPYMLGQEVYEMICQLKILFDPKSIFNKGKIIGTPPMNTYLRFNGGNYARKIETVMCFGDEGILCSVERCNGSADCRKPKEMGGLMCPTYMATLDEMMTTRARANVLREVLTFSTKSNPFDDESLYEVMSLCISCKACKKECPSNVDMAKLKAEALYQYYKSHHTPLRSWLIGEMPTMYSVASKFKGIFNAVVSNKQLSSLIKRSINFAPQRTIPKLQMMSKPKQQSSILSTPNGKVYLFADEFTRYNEGKVGNMAIELLQLLGYTVELADIKNSGRTYISKGLLDKARKLAIHNVKALSNQESLPIIGLEPSTILSFRDEYPDLVGDELREAANALSLRTLLFEEFFIKIIKEQKLKGLFSTKQKLFLHGHCQQKAVASIEPLRKMLEFVGYDVTVIESCCCGMAGSFGYEKENYDLSMKIGELFLFPEVRKAPEEALIVAPGVSCRHQIFDGTGRTAIHPIEAMLKAFKGSKNG